MEGLRTQASLQRAKAEGRGSSTNLPNRKSFKLDMSEPKPTNTSRTSPPKSPPTPTFDFW